MIQIVVSGVVSDCVFSHVHKGINYYKLKLHCKRLSGTEDILPVTLSEAALAGVRGCEKILVHGNVMTRDIGEKLELYVQAHQVYKHRNTDDVNHVMGTGFLVKKNTVRVTSQTNRTLLNFILASNGKHGSSYIPTMAWNEFAVAISKVDIGEELTIIGRLQSRDYHKSGSGETKTTYELSIKYAEKGGRFIA